MIHILNEMKISIFRNILKGQIYKIKVDLVLCSIFLNLVIFMTCNSRNQIAERNRRLFHNDLILKYINVLFDSNFFAYFDDLGISIFIKAEIFLLNFSLNKNYQYYALKRTQAPLLFSVIC